jgi:hypothetical protein
LLFLCCTVDIDGVDEQIYGASVVDRDACLGDVAELCGVERYATGAVAQHIDNFVETLCARDLLRDLNLIGADTYTQHK